MHLQTADARMSAWRAKNWDLTCFGTVTVAGIMGLGCYAFVVFATRGISLAKVSGQALKLLLPASVVSISEVVIRCFIRA